MSDLIEGPFCERESIPDTAQVTKNQGLDSPETLGKTKHNLSIKERKKMKGGRKE